MKRYIASIAAFALTLAVFWVGGVEFERGANQAFVLYVAIVVAALAYMVLGLQE